MVKLRPDELFFKAYAATQMDLNFDFCGLAHGPNATSNGQMLKGNAVIHYVLRGKGSFACNGHTVVLGPGDCFLLPPNVPTAYWPDATNPWEYFWLGMSGTKVTSYLGRSALTTANYLHCDPDSQFVKQLHALMALAQAPADADHDLLLTGELYRLLYWLAREHPQQVTPLPRQARYLRQAQAFLEANYDRPLSVVDVAGHLNLSRGYLYRLFKDGIGVSPQQYLVGLRLQKGADLLARTSFPVQQIAQAVGYVDPLAFSRSFTRAFGQAPTQYRAKRASKENNDEI
ncbi:AraC family transcriptional regulator [Lacticaseibacillus parakribbianus]|uniref:AraC family transcriptional regulator n=1 Tax=Lacticaseibacillus parakribbianus TaxID=2970927 RepID=UPI0021CB3AD5|nr:AraC family ligand binding domain-containing protein [Lacticaseibacillus parakribbianus]